MVQTLPSFLSSMYATQRSVCLVLFLVLVNHVASGVRSTVGQSMDMQNATTEVSLFSAGHGVKQETSLGGHVKYTANTANMTNGSSLEAPSFAVRPHENQTTVYDPDDLDEVYEEMQEVQMVKDIVGGFGTIMAIVMYGSSLPVLRDIYRRKNVGEYSFMPYFGQWLSTYAQVCYSIFRGLDAMLMNFLANGLGFLLASCSLTVYGLYAADRRLKFLLVFAAGLVASATALLLVPVTQMDCSTVPSPKCWWSGVALVTNVAMYAGPCLIFAHVWHSKSTEFMPLSVAVGQLLCSTPWMLYGLCLGDPTIYAPNVIGVGFAFMQFALYTYISWQYPQEVTIERRASLLGAIAAPSDDDEEIEPFVQQCASYGYIASLTRTVSQKPKLPDNIGHKW